ncbi:MAG: histidine kinase [Rikenellaceae bacterium]
MKRSSKIIIDIMIAVAISLVVNFSHLLLIFVDQEQQPHENVATQSHGGGRGESVRVEGIFAMSPDGHGYLISGDGVDSAYVSKGRVDRYALVEGDSLATTIILAPDDGRRHDMVQSVLRRNGNIVAPYSYSAPQRWGDFITQLLYYFALSFVIIVVATVRSRRGVGRRFTFIRVLFAISLAILLYLAAPLVTPRQRGEFIFNLMLRGVPIIELMVTLKWSFAVIVSILYSQIYTLLSQRQNIILENEQLRSESINAQYNMLMSQINPHFFFNSLNSLSMLVRERDEERSLIYIDQLSYTFRYILQNRESTLTTLSEEMKFVEAYIYLFKIRYADKLFFDIDIDRRYDDYRIPALSLQPLLDNAVKHNTILSSRPFHVSISVEGGVMKISNRKYPKLEAEPSTGVGLENLRRRWLLIASRSIEVEQNDDQFIVKLPLLKPQV